jgi:hypothetical protein
VYGHRKRDKVTGEWRKLHKEELNDLYFSPQIVRVMTLIRMRWPGHVSCMGRGKACTGFWWEITEGKRPLGRPMRKWEDNIRADLQDVECGSKD